MIHERNTIGTTSLAPRGSRTMGGETGYSLPLPQVTRKPVESKMSFPSQSESFCIFESLA